MYFYFNNTNIFYPSEVSVCTIVAPPTISWPTESCTLGSRNFWLRLKFFFNSYVNIIFRHEARSNKLEGEHRMSVVEVSYS